MDEQVKVLYSWIGPHGPIGNTELPNLLQLAGLVGHEHVQVKSRYFWAEEIHRKLFRKLPEKYDVYPVNNIRLDDDRMFVIPFYITWRTPLIHYFSNNSGILEFSHISKHLFPLIRENNGYIMIWLPVEAFILDIHIAAMHSYFGESHKFPLHKIIYVIGCPNANEIYNDYCVRNNIPDRKEDRLTIISYQSSIDIFHNLIDDESKEPPYDTNIIPEKLFLMWNRRYRPHRTELALHLELNNCVDNSYISFPERHVEMSTVDFYSQVGPIHEKYPYMDDSLIKRFGDRLPLVLDNETDIIVMCQDTDNRSRPYYQNSLISIVTETNYYDSAISLTEKSFKPMKEKHPFITVGVNGALREIRNLGFKTFNDFWDESYDDILDPVDRMKKLNEIIANISSWTAERKIDFRKAVKPILDYNYQHLRNCNSSKMTAEKIYDIINKNKVV